MSGNKILVIEDHQLNLELVTDLLEASGFFVFSAPSAEEGLRMARELSPQLVLMDFSLPGMDGLSATKNLKANPATRHLSVVGLTAHAMKGDEELALNAGCDGYLTKPIDTRTFIESIKRFIASANSGQKANDILEKGTDCGEISDAKSARSGKASSLGFVLVVDDEEQNRTLLCDPLEARGYEVAEAENGIQALQKIAARLPDVILLDLMMPKMDGFEVCRRLRKDPATSHIPILMITALSERKERLAGIEAGANDFLNKPVDIQDVALRVKNAIQAKHLHDKLQVEREKTDRLLLNILPAPIAERMKNGETNIADTYAGATVLVANLMGFTSLSAHIDPRQVVHLLNEFFSSFDVLTEKREVEKIKTIGGAYVVAGGVSLHQLDQAEAVTELALDLRKEVDRLNQMYATSFQLRTGISTGPVIAGIIGQKKFAYDIWGETIDLAWQLESTAEPAEIQIDQATYRRLRHKCVFVEKQGVGDKRYSNWPVS